MEALSLGAKAVVSDASCMREIFGNNVYYIDPYNPDVDMDKLLKTQVESPKNILEKYSWINSAQTIYKIIKSQNLSSQDLCVDFRTNFAEDKAESHRNT